MTKSEALAKVKQLMKEAIAKKGAMPTFKYSFVEDNLNNLHMALQLGKMTGDDAENTIQQIEGVLAQYGAKTAENASGAMTPEEYKAAKSAMYQKYKAGEITNYAYIQWKKKNDPALKAQSGAVSASAAKAGTGAGAAAAAAKPATDPGQQAADEAVEKLEKELKKVYTAAAKEMKTQLKEFTDQFNAELTEKQEKVYAGEMTQAQLQAWINSQHQMKKILEQKIDQCTGVMLNANQKAMGMINGQTLGVFAENANWQSYQLTQDTKMNLMFSVYDEHTVKKLIQDKPELLPRKVVNGKKDKAWNQKKIANAVTQAVIQGESIPKLARRIAVQTGETNMKAMVRYARTAMTSAQNAGRQEMLERAQGMGIKVKKVWMATLDGRTRDTHAALDGQAVGVDEKFSNGLMFPGDPSGPPGEVYNCRCTMVYDYEGFPHDPVADQRLDNESGQMIQNMTYPEWKAAKESSMLNDLNIAKYSLADAQKAVIKAKVKEDKVYSGLWKDDVTLADYEAKKDGIPAKRDYYDTEIEKYKQAQAEGKSWATDEKIKDLQKKRKLLNEFEKNGELLKKRNEALKKVQEIYNQVGFQKSAQAPTVAQNKAKKKAQASSKANTPSPAPTMDLGTAGAKKTPFGPEAYTQERKDKALWTTDRSTVDGVMRKHTGEMWLNATKEERVAIHEYTYSYHKFNEPLRGIEYGTNRYLGVGKTDLNAGSKRSGRKLNAITDLLDKCSYDHDMWLQRGVRFSGMDKFFNCPMSLLQNGTQKQLQDALLGTTPTEYAFGSMGSAKGKGFSGDILMNIYAPAGTKMMFLEPFSYYGHNKHGALSEMDGVNWDGKTTQPSYGTEFETLLQQGTQFRVTKVERRGSGTIYVDLEVINQDNQQRWKP